MGTSLESVEKQWEQLLEAKDLSTLGEQDFGIVMGGDFVAALSPFVAGGWLQHSITGGKPIDPTSLEPVPFKVEDCLIQDGMRPEGLAETNGGMRLLLSRAMADDWFVALRSDTFLERSKDPLDQVVGYLSGVVKEICSTEESDSNLNMIEFYRELTVRRDNMSREQWQQILVRLESVEREYADSGTVQDAAVAAAFRAFGPLDVKDDADADAGGGFFSITRELATLDLAVQK